MGTMNDVTVVIMWRNPLHKVVMMVSTLIGKGVDLVEGLIRHWVEVDRGLLFNYLKKWIRKEEIGAVKQLYVNTVRTISEKHRVDSR